MLGLMAYLTRVNYLLVDKFWVSWEQIG